MLINLINSIDRIVIGVLAEPIKRDLLLADWQLGMMTGFAFALFLSVFGLPIARLADRSNRPFVLIAAITVWSVFTTLCGVAQNFVQLCLCRVGVGVGEAGCTPAGHSLIADYTTREKRASALALFSMGVPLGSLVGLPMAGIITDHFGWRAAFFFAGLPGLILAVVAAFSLREPRTRGANKAAKAQQMAVREVFKLLLRKPTFWLLCAAACLVSFVGYGQSVFTISFFLRTHGPEIASIASNMGMKSVGFMGLALGILAGGGGAIGILIGGWLGDKATAKNPRDAMIAPAIAILASSPLFICALLADSAVSALVILTLPYLLHRFWSGPVYATVQGIVPAEMRSSASAVLLFFVNLLGAGGGPFLVGALSDILSQTMGLSSAEGLRWSLIASALIGLPAGIFLFMARKTLPKDLES
jgi:MFS family permease